MSGFNWLSFIPVSFVSKKPVALLNANHLDLIGHLGINKFILLTIIQALLKFCLQPSNPLKHLAIW